jgi:5-methylcytosine-specific restriction endonuclease McrA
MSASKYSSAHLPDEVLLRDLPKLGARDRETLAEILGKLAEIDSRRLYVPAAYPSMVAYCMGELRLSEDSALKRIRAARAAREFPAILDAIADGRLSLTAVVLLKPHLTEDTADELLAAAENKSKTEVEALVARVKQPELRSSVVPEPPRTTATAAEPSPAFAMEVVPEPPRMHAAQVVPEPPRNPESLLAAPSCFGPIVTPMPMLRVQMDREIEDLLRQAQDLLSHQLPTGSPTEVVKRALRTLVRELERKKFARTEAARPPRQPSANRTRHIPAHVKRAVRERDGCQCTFVSASGRRCESRTRLEFDHVLEYARGGVATVDGIRLRCRTHNQYTAEQTFGPAFMSRKRKRRGTQT